MDLLSFFINELDGANFRPRTENGVRMDENKEMHLSDCYYRTQMQKEIIIDRLKENGCRITKQRLMLLDVILEKNYSSCKEIYYEASKRDNRIGTATVYRMVNLLEEIGAISRKNMYRVLCDEKMEDMETCIVELDDQSVKRLSMKDWNLVVREGLKVCGYLKTQKVVSVSVGQTE